MTAAGSPGVLGSTRVVLYALAPPSPAGTRNPKSPWRINSACADAPGGVICSLSGQQDQDTATRCAEAGLLREPGGGAGGVLLRPEAVPGTPWNNGLLHCIRDGEPV